MTIKNINYPRELDIVKATSWNKLGKHNFSIARFHLYIKDYQSEDKTYPGEILGSFRTVEELEVIQAIEKEHTVIDIDETICSTAISHEIVSMIGGELLASLEPPLYKISAKTNASLQKSLQSTTGISTKVTKTNTRSVMERFEIKHTLTSKGTYHVVACYQPRNADVYLHYIDYLIAEYSHSMFGLRKKKKNNPRPQPNGNHINLIKVNQPLYRLKYWKLKPLSSMMYSESEYESLEKKIIKPEKVKLKKLGKQISLPIPKHPERPTLYTLSNIAFPLLWIKHEGDWKIEELRQIELEDAEGTLWWFQHGPGRNTK